MNFSFATQGTRKGGVGGYDVISNWSKLYSYASLYVHILYCLGPTISDYKTFANCIFINWHSNRYMPSSLALCIILHITSFSKLFCNNFYLQLYINSIG